MLKVIRRFPLLLALAVAPIGSTVANDDLVGTVKALQEDPPNWLPSLETCPADVLPQRIADFENFADRCAETPDACATRCSEADATACYSLALAVQEVDSGPVSERLFLRACELGVVSGCTNRAAGMIEEDFQCSLATFEFTCEQSDPWGCTMLGLFLATGRGVAQDVERARAVLAKSCPYGDEDEACSYAKQILKTLDNAQ